VKAPTFIANSEERQLDHSSTLSQVEMKNTGIKIIPDPLYPCCKFTTAKYTRELEYEQHHENLVSNSWGRRSFLACL